MDGDDNWAARAKEADWWSLAGQRASLGLFVAAFAGAVLLGFNHVLARRALVFPWLQPARIAWLAAAAIAFTSLIGAIDFIIERPYM